MSVSIRSFTVILALAAAAVAAPAGAREQIRIVGSSTVYPFATVVAEEFGRSTKFKTPIVESTGTGGGLKLFCGGVGVRPSRHRECLAPHQASPKSSCARRTASRRSPRSRSATTAS